VSTVRWSSHAQENLVDREIDRAEAERTLAAPDLVRSEPPNQRILMRRYFDGLLHQDMLIRIVVEDGAADTVVVTIYKTSQIDKYLKGPTQ
jgi:hypothetical protein